MAGDYRVVYLRGGRRRVGRVLRDPPIEAALTVAGLAELDPPCSSLCWKLWHQIDDWCAAAAEFVEQRSQVERIRRVEFDERAYNLLGHLRLAEFFQRPQETAAGFEERLICEL